MRILVVEDEPIVHRMITTILKMDYLDVVIDVAETGNAALASYGSCGPYALVITDYAHPGGLFADELVEVIRASNPEQAFILQTGNTGSHIDDFTERWKDIPYLPKPWRASQFSDLMKQMVR